MALYIPCFVGFLLKSWPMNTDVEYEAKWTFGLIRCAHAWCLVWFGSGFFNHDASKADWHSFRRTCCNLNDDSGSPPREVAARSQHSISV